MNKADRLRRAAPGATDSQIAALAALPSDEVTAIAMFARQAGRDALAAAAERKRQRKADDKKQANYDEDDYTRRNLAVITSQAQRAKGGSLDALAALAQVLDHVDYAISWAVAGCRAEGLPDAAIGEALGYKRYARQEVNRRFGKRRTVADVGESPTPGDQAG